MRFNWDNGTSYYPPLPRPTAFWLALGFIFSVCMCVTFLQTCQAVKWALQVELRISVNLAFISKVVRLVLEPSVTDSVREYRSLQTGAVTCMAGWNHSKWWFECWLTVSSQSLYGSWCSNFYLSPLLTEERGMKMANNVFLCKHDCCKNILFSPYLSWKEVVPCVLLCSASVISPLLGVFWYLVVNVRLANWNIVSLWRLLLPRRRLSLLIANCRSEINTLSF